MSGTRRYLLAYDITDPRRLARVARLVSKEALRIQYSVYLTELSPSRLRDLIAALRALIDPRFDDLRIYPLPSRLDAVWYGRATWPEGIPFEGSPWTKLTAGDATGYRTGAPLLPEEREMTHPPGPENSAERSASALKKGGKSTPAVQTQT